VTGPAAPVTRRELVDRLRRRLGLSAREAGELLDGFLETLADQLAEGGIVSLSGLGRLETRLTPARPGRNPKTGREVIIPARRRPVFTLSRTLRTMLKETSEEDQDR
jgi:integration host factor subunit alpha